MANTQGRGWHGDPEGHAEASHERDKKHTNWLPLLLLPIAFILGWAGHDATTKDTHEVAQQQSTIQPGVGGGPATTITPTGSSSNTTNDGAGSTNMNGNGSSSVTDTPSSENGGSGF